MDALYMNTMTTAGAAGDVRPSVASKMTREEAQALSDAELLQMIQKSQGHTGKNFSDYMNCEFSYTYLTGLLRERGYENGWHKPSEEASESMRPTVIRMKKTDVDTVRKSFIIEESVAEEWKAFNKNIPFPSITLGCALRRFMEDYNSGHIKFELEI